MTWQSGGDQGGQKAVLLMRIDPSRDPHGDMSELRGLAEAAGYQVIAQLMQRHPRDARYQLGRGKIAQAVELQPDVLIFRDPLSPGQYFNIQSQFPCRILDRFNLILEIFASRASSREAMLQVELARLTYEAPLVRSMISLRKLSERPGFHGGGAYEESQLQDYRGRMARIREELRSVERTGESRRVRRRSLGFNLVALAGYTNAGKSTLLNRLTQASAEVRDQLFTTLCPITRALPSRSNKILLTDTVGFIDHLPHFLIKSFRSTLGEIAHADLVILVADASDDLQELRRKLAASHRALWECGCRNPVVTALNKADRLRPEEEDRIKEGVRDLAPCPVMVSAQSGQGLDQLLLEVEKNLPPQRLVEISLPNSPEGWKAVSRMGRRAQIVGLDPGEELRLKLRGRGDAQEVVEDGLSRDQVLEDDIKGDETGGEEVEGRQD